MTKKLKKKLSVAWEGFFIGGCLVNAMYRLALWLDGIHKSFDGWISIVVFIAMVIFLILDLREKDDDGQS